MSNCDSCIFRSTYPKTVRFCLALCKFVDDPDNMPCAGRLYEETEGNKQEQIVEKLKELRNETI